MERIYNCISCTESPRALNGLKSAEGPEVKLSVQCRHRNVEDIITWPVGTNYIVVK